MFGAMDSMDRVSEICLDSQLWHACAGSMVQIPQLNSEVFYFPQGHAEHAIGKVDFGNTPIPPLIPCRVNGIKFMAEFDTDEVYVKLRLTPLRENDFDLEDDYCIGIRGVVESKEKPVSFTKTLTQSDANNGGGFSVPRYCAETIFPELDYSTVEPPVQTIIARDVHGQRWKFRHIYRGTPKRHLLTTGWSNFVNHKKLVAGDSVLFLRAENGDICVGIRRAKKGIGGGSELSSSCWNTNQLGPLLFDGGNENNKMLNRRKVGENLMGKVAAESVIEAVNCAVNGRPFEVVYYPRANTPEFYVKASAVRAAMQIQWCSGMRFKMPFETEDSYRKGWFIGTVTSVQVVDPIRWPSSPWRFLQVVWDEPHLLQNVKCVNPWLVEVVSNIPNFHFSPFSPTSKKPRFPISSFSNNLLNHTNSVCNIQGNSSAGIQGARHAQYGLSRSNFLVNTPQHHRPPWDTYKSGTKNNVDISCLLTVGNTAPEAIKLKSSHILLFGQLIHTEQEHNSNIFSAERNGNSSTEATLHKTSIASEGLASTSLQNSHIENSSDGGSQWYKDLQKSDLRTENVNRLCLAL
ncbi:hypothetical protein Lal_00028652 [Lupinus albus]|uniref:Auxin response factor n=1 Tax=Lupinus albus TaxID=3870 RepID=A0A6A4NTV4_LUPAL|nr:putative transcription factor ARF family [Lupinus albus]KAF1884766.1 hypothetical protein Lal_00028652 [Lupinus albus]